MNNLKIVSVLVFGLAVMTVSCRKLDSGKPSNTPPPPNPNLTYLHATKVVGTISGPLAILTDQTVIVNLVGNWYPANNLTGITDVTCNMYALKNDGTVWISDTTGHTFNWSMVNGLTNIIAIAAMPGTTTRSNLALKADGTVWAWGQNRFGELGDSTYLTRTVPVQVKHITGITAIAMGMAHCLALKNDGTVWGWGQNSFGELGTGATANTSYTTPIQVNGFAGITSIAAGNSTTLVIKSDGTVWGSGYNVCGCLGNNTGVNSSTPVQASGLAGIKSVCGGDGFSVALRNDSTVWAWGLNSTGSLGNGSSASQSLVPVPVSYLTGVTSINTEAIIYSGYAIEKDGVAWTWGSTNGIGGAQSVPQRVVR